MNKYISGEIIDLGIDGEKFIPDDLYVCDKAKIANKCRDKRTSKVYRLVEIKKYSENEK